MLAGRVKEWRKELNRDGSPVWERTATRIILEIGFGPIPSVYVKIIEQADEESLLIWSERATIVDSLEDVFADGN